MKEKIRELLLSSGAVAVGFTKAGKVTEEVSKKYSGWIEAGNHAGMSYLVRHIKLRKNTDNVLPNAKTVISLAFSYSPKERRNPDLPMIAGYALGCDYHDVIRKRLTPLVSELIRNYGGDWRICVDSAPMEERFWAVKSGLGFIGRNGALIVEGCGSYCFLAEILTTVEMEQDKSMQNDCLNCGKCIKACPSGAINSDCTIDSRKCLSYITIEKKGDFNNDEKKLLTKTKTGILFGCDICLDVCPHNADITPSSIEEFKANDEMIALTAKAILDMDETQIRESFKHSPVKRAGFNGMIRNATSIISPSQD